MERSLSEFIGGLEVREPIRAGGVTVYPLFNHGKMGPTYTLLADALAGRRRVEVDGVDDALEPRVLPRGGAHD